MYRLNHVPRVILRKSSVTVAVILALIFLYGRLFAGKILQYQASPDQQNIAEWRIYEESSATTTDLSAIELKTRFWPFRHTVLSGLDYGAKISVDWVNSTTLVIRCANCGGFEVKCDNCALYIVRKETKWHNVLIHYSAE
jgi:hypothetical protein